MITTPTARSQVNRMKTTPIGPYSLSLEMIASERNAAENAPSPRKKAEVTIAGTIKARYGTRPASSRCIPSQKNAAISKKLVNAARPG